MTTPFSPSGRYSSFFHNRSALRNLIMINIAVFILINLVDLLFWLFKVAPVSPYGSGSLLVHWLSVPADFNQLLVRPWGIFTYMFSHQDLFHILFNMITLYFGGQIFLSLLNEKKLVSTYLLGGLAGAVFFILSYNIFPVFRDSLPYALAIGASASVLAILIAAAAYAPDYTVYLIFIGKIKLKYIALILILIDLLSISKDNPGGHIAHLGGAAWGFLYIRVFLNHGWKGLSGINPFTLFKIKRKSHKKTYTKRPVTDEEYNTRKNENQEKIDRILEKISRNGYNGLTKEEKEILFKAGKK